MAAKVLDNKKMPVPELRFDGFRDEWKKKRLGEIATITTGNTPSTTITEYYNGSRLFVSPADINDVRYVHKTKTTLTELGFKEGRKISKGSVLFVCIGSTIGKVGQAAEECLTNQQINSLEALRDFDNNFIYGLLEKNGKKIKLLAGVQAVPQINKTDFSNFKYYFPTLPEQQKIASFLSAVDEKIQQLSRKKELLEQYKKGVMQKLFSQELRFKPTLSGVEGENGKAFPKWEEKFFKDFVIDYRLGGNYENTEEFTIYPLIKMGNLDRGKIKIDKIEYIPTNQPIDPKDEIKYGDLFFNTRNTLDLVGKVAIWRNELPKAYYNSNLMYLKFENNFFMNYRLNSYDGVKALKRFATGTTSVAAIYTKDLLKLELSIPCIEEQKKIADYLSNIDNKIESVTKQITQTQTFKKGLLQQMFV
jgi:type I restriction enzyme S subunit